MNTQELTTTEKLFGMFIVACVILSPEILIVISWVIYNIYIDKPWFTPID